MTLHKITEFYKQWFSVYPNINSKFCTIPTVKSFTNQNDDSSKTVGMVMLCYFTKLHLSKCRSSWTTSIKQNINFSFQLPSTFVFLAFHKNGLIKASSSFEYLSAYKVSLSHVDSFKFRIHLRSLNVHKFGVIKVTGLKIYVVLVNINGMTSIPNFITNLPVCSEVIRKYTLSKRQTEWWSHKP